MLKELKTFNLPVRMFLFFFSLGAVYKHTQWQIWRMDFSLYSVCWLSQKIQVCV